MTAPHLWISNERTRSEPIAVRGGGDSYIREDAVQHSRQLLAAFNRSVESFATKHDFDVASDLIVQITTVAERSIAKERVHLRNLGFEVLALSEDAPNVAIGRLRVDKLPTFSRKLERYAGSEKNVGKGNFGAIESITPVGIQRKIDPRLTEVAEDDEVDCLITLFSALPEEKKDAVANRIADELREQGKVGVAIYSFANGVTGVATNLNREEMQRISRDFMFVRAIESNEPVFSESATAADPLPAIIQIDRVHCRTPVVVIDSGVSGGSPLMAGLVLRTFNELPPRSTGPHLTHGTFVASRVAYGDGILSIRNRRASPWCPIIDVQVTGADELGNRISQGAAELGAILQRIVPALRDEAKVFNLSLGFAPINDGRYSSLARLIDYLSREYKVLFVISAGNIDEPTAHPPRHYFATNTRILSPSESLLSLTVASIAKYTEVDCIADIDEVSPYSRRGPGADQALKPELAAHGGNVFFNVNEWTTSPRVGAYGLGRLGTNLDYGFGTSYAAPLISQYAARLFDAYPAATPNLVRALLCHFADAVNAPAPGDPIRARDFCGFGEPSVTRAMFAGEHSASYLFEGSIFKDHYLFIPFYVPSALANDASTRLSIKGTVVFDPPVSVDDSVDYSLCRVTGLLRKLGANGLQDVSIGGAEDDARYPWNPILQFDHDFRRGYASGEWELRLRLMTRGDLPPDFAQSIAVIIEVIDLANRVDVRSEILSEVQLYSPVVLRVAA